MVIYKLVLVAQNDELLIPVNGSHQSVTSNIVHSRSAI